MSNPLLIGLVVFLLLMVLWLFPYWFTHKDSRALVKEYQELTTQIQERSRALRDMVKMDVEREMLVPVLREKLDVLEERLKLAAETVAARNTALHAKNKRINELELEVAQLKKRTNSDEEITDCPSGYCPKSELPVSQRSCLTCTIRSGILQSLPRVSEEVKRGDAA